MPKTINEYFQPASTGVHSNIDNLILQSKLDEFDRYGSMRVPPIKYKGGVDDVVANVAMNPLMTLKSLGNVGKKLIEKTGLRNPVYHFTKGERVRDILSEGAIKGAKAMFPGKPFYKDSRKYLDKLLDRDKTGWLSETDIAFQEQFPRSPSVSITRDPKFLSRPHKHIGTDVRFILDRDEMIKKGLKMEPFAEGLKFQKVIQRKVAPNIGKKIINMKIKNREGLPTQLNPRFEFEERVRGNIPTENIKLIDLIRFSPNEFLTSINNQDLIKALAKSKIPKIKSKTAYNQLLDLNKRLRSKNWEDKVSKQGGVLHIADTRGNLLKYIDELLDTPTYKFDPFKRRNTP
jgi:hypothetical protein